MRSFLNKLKKIPLSNKDILKAVNYKSNFIIYPDLKNYDSIDDIFNGKKSILLLYLQTPMFGHWCCLNIIGKNKLEFFDPYSIIIDNELKFNTKENNNKLGQKLPYLSQLLINSDYKLSYNHYKFQSQKSNINTCGRWCILRINNNNLTLKEFKNEIDKFKFIGDYDDIAAFLTFYIGE